MASDFLTDIDAAAEQAAKRAATTITATVNGHRPEPDHPLVKRALEARITDLAVTPPGSRNDALNKAAVYLGRFPIDRGQLRDLLMEACQANNLQQDDGYKACNDTISSGFAKADRDGPRTIEDRTNVTVTEVGAETLTEDEGKDLHQIAVEHRAYELRVNDEARALWTRQRAALMGQQPPDMVCLKDFLAVPDEDTVYRVNDLLPVGGRALLVAQYKAGKTSLIANLLRCLVDNDLFLNRFGVAPIERVLLIDTELDERTLRRWLRDQTIRNTDGINILSLKGRLASFAITDDQVRAEWAKRVHGAQFIMLDCLRPCLDALGLSEDKEAGVFLTAFDALCKEVGAGEAVVVHHMGHTEERSRGDSRLLDWPDALWKLVREADEDGNNDDSGDRFFSAVGRDVLVGESQLSWEPDTRNLTICGGGRNTKKAGGHIDDIIEIMLDPANSDGLSQTQLVNKLKVYGVGRNIARLAVRQAVDDNILVVSTGPRDSKIHNLNPSWRNDDSSTSAL